MVGMDAEKIAHAQWDLSQMIWEVVFGKDGKAFVAKPLMIMEMEKLVILKKRALLAAQGKVVMAFYVFGAKAI